MYEAQKQMEQWAVSKNKPGQFLGSTGARVLPKHEFNTGIQAYAKKEQFTKAERVSSYLIPGGGVRRETKENPVLRLLGLRFLGDFCAIMNFLHNLPYVN
jgi:hypothetical protein